MSRLDLDQAEFLFHSDGLRDSSLHVHRFTGREALSQTFEFSVELVSDDPDLDLEAPIGQAAYLTLRGHLPNGTRYDRIVHGVIERFVQLSAGIRHSRYEATLVPTLKPLLYTRDSRIFQRMSTPEVAKKILTTQVQSDWLNLVLHARYEPRDYCVQYQESALDFVQRLFEEEGIFYFFDQRKDRDILVVGDGSYAFETLGEYAAVLLRDRPHLYEEGLSTLRPESALRSGAAVLRDFRFKQPGLDLEASAQSERFKQYQMYYFPGEYVDPQLGERLVRMRLEEQQCQRNRFVGQGNVRAMLPGYKFTLSGHRRKDCNKEYLLVAVEHEGFQPAALAEEGHGGERTVYQNRVECIPASVSYRPPRRTPRPSIPGVQTAVVVGPAGEEIHCDEHGRVKVQFHWDRDGQSDDNSSCWIRVSQPWGGAGQGGMFIPRIGQEVVVQFLEGDPDRPLIVGRVYNGENLVPHGLPAAKNISTIRSASTPGGKGFNELKFNDTAGSEEVFFHAQKDHNEVVGNDHNAQITANQSNTVGVNQSESIGSNQSLSVGGNRSASVKGNESLSVSSNQTQSVTGSQSISVDGGQSVAIKSGQGTTITGGQSISVDGGQSIAVTGGQSTQVTGDESITVATNLGVSVAAMTSIQSGAQIAASAPQITISGTLIGIQGISVQTEGLVIGTSGLVITLSGAVVGIEGSAAVSVSGAQVSVSGSTVGVTGESSVSVEGGSVSVQGGSVAVQGGIVTIN